LPDYIQKGITANFATTYSDVAKIIFK